MRPHRLTLSAFGPYADKQEIDFRALGDRSFFLIHGATGAGKTTVLDAICFALYGSTTADDRTGRQMRSDLAAPGLMTEVFLDFSVGEESFRIHRIPEHEVVRRNKTVTQKAQATLWKRTGLGTGAQYDHLDGNLLTAGWKEVTRAVESVLGYQKDQFRQVVVLPQGQFRKLLVATSKERESILEMLFRTEYFRSAELALKQAAGSVVDSIKQIDRQRQTHLTMAGVETRQDLFAKHERTRIVLERTRADLKTGQSALAIAQEKVGVAQVLSERLQEAQVAAGELEQLCERTDAIEEKRVELQAALKAAQLSDVRHALGTQERAANNAAEIFEKAKFNLETARSQFVQIEKTWESEQRKEAQRTEARETLRRLEELGVQVKQLELVRREAEELQAELNDVTANRQQTEAEIEKRVQQLEALRQKCTQAAQAASQLAGMEALAKSAARNLDTAKSLVKARRQVEECERAVAAAEKRLRDEEDLLAVAQKELLEIEAAWNSGQAAILAQTLEPGHSCPVCGSLEHPQPASTSLELPTEAVVEEHRRRCKLKEHDRDLQRAALSKRQLELAALLSAQTELEKQLVESGTDVTVLQAACIAASEQVEKIRTTIAMHGDLTGRVQAAEKYMSQLDARLSTDNVALKTINDRWREKLGVLGQLESAVPEESRDLPLLQKQIEAARAGSNQLQMAFERAQQQFSTAREALATRTAEMESAEKTLAGEQWRLAEAQKMFESKLRSFGFECPEEFERCQRPPEVVKRLEVEVQRFEGALQAAHERNLRAQESAQNVQAPDIVALQKELESTQQHCNQLLIEETNLARDLDTVETCSSKLEELEAKFGELEQRYRVVGTIAEVANGDNQLNVTFQRFVLGALLDDVLIAATQRLNIMSKGRYYLQRSTTSQDGRKTGGLDLEVTDTFTGTNRNVATLSGGESFLASLSLALGLADVVQSYAGGIHLDTIFVDEGFGTLDPEALDLALRALIDLQKMGRLVGIISHVPELKERIDARLEIMSGRNGSSARFVVA